MENLPLGNPQLRVQVYNAIAESILQERNFPQARISLEMASAAAKSIFDLPSTLTTLRLSNGMHPTSILSKDAYCICTSELCLLDKVPDVGRQDVASQLQEVYNKYNSRVRQALRLPQSAYLIMELLKTGDSSM